MTDLAPAAASALERVREIRLVLDWLRQQGATLTAERDAAILQLVAAGLSYEAIARQCGVTRGRVGQIVQTGG